MRMWCQPAFQYILNLQSESFDWTDLVELLTGEVMNERDYIMRANEAQHPLLVTIVSEFKGFLTFDFGSNSWVNNFART
jgi:hypothetical protein